MTSKIRDIAIMVMALAVATLCFVLIIAVIALYPSVSDMLGNLGNATATLNRALVDVEDAAQAITELANRTQTLEVWMTPPQR